MEITTNEITADTSTRSLHPPFPHLYHRHTCITSFLLSTHTLYRLTSIRTIYISPLLPSFSPFCLPFPFILPPYFHHYRHYHPPFLSHIPHFLIRSYLIPPFPSSHTILSPLGLYYPFLSPLLLNFYRSPAPLSFSFPSRPFSHQSVTSTSLSLSISLSHLSRGAAKHKQVRRLAIGW